MRCRTYRPLTPRTDADYERMAAAEVRNKCRAATKAENIRRSNAGSYKFA